MNKEREGEGPGRVPVRVGVVGCGVIAGAYLPGLKAFADLLEVVAVADRDRSKAEERAVEFSVPDVRSTASLLASDDIDVVVNLTIPAAHVEVSSAAIAAGKSVYSEKPLAVDAADGHALVAEAAAAGVVLGCAPDTVLGRGIQTCRRLIDEGAIGEPVGATATMLIPGHEHWHPDPGFYYRAGGGPLLDMGPYYVTALVALLGPVAEVAGMARASFPERVARAGRREGERFPVEVDTHTTAALRFAAGPLVSLSMSFDVWLTSIPPIEVYGSEGTMWVPDPNRSNDPIRLFRFGDAEPVEVDADPGWDGVRGAGVADVAAAVRAGGDPVGSGALAAHVLDVLAAVPASSSARAHVTVPRTIERPRAFAWPPAG